MAKNIGVLWDGELEWGREKPFENRIDQTYSFFSEIADRNDLKFFIAKYTWYDHGKLERAYRWNGSSWEKRENIEIDGVFDKFKFDEETEKLKKQMAEEVGILNVPELEKLCKDKLLTYRKFPEMVPETRKAGEEEIESMLEKHGKVVVKPRYAFGGKGIQILEKGEEYGEVDPEDYVVQEFFDSSEGIPGIVDTHHDLRAIVVNGEIAGAYLRFNRESEISNVSQGGEKRFVPLEEFPEKGLEMVEEVAERFSRFNPSVFSVDLMFSGEEARVVELNTKPGLSFFDDEDLKEMSRNVMEKYCDALRRI